MDRSGREGRGSAAVRAISLLLCMMLAVERVTGADIQVGGSPGWLLGVNFSQWAKSVKVKSGDTLVFKYPAEQHSVIQTTSGNYGKCSVSGALGSFSSGNDRVTVTGPGTYYFFCPTSNHCKQGMKVAIHVAK